MPAAEQHDRGKTDCISETAAVEAALSLPPNRIRVFGGLSAKAFRRCLDDHAAPNSARSAFFAEPRFDRGAEVVVEDVVSALADAALASWPLWYGGADFGFYRATLLHRESARSQLADIAAAVPGVSDRWARAAVALAYSGQAPRASGWSPAAELAQLALALSPAGLLLVVSATLEGTRATPLVAALEWLARQAPVSVIVLCPEGWGGEAFERLLYHASWIAPDNTHPAQTNTPAPGSTIWLPPVLGRPHPLSLVEQRVASALARDLELGALFSFNQTVRTVRGTQPRADLVWQEGKLVVELDGYADHAERTKFMADRHRDYELALSGYAVLRIANDEAAVDLERAVEKIRDMVRLRRAQLAVGGGQWQEIPIQNRP